MGKERWGGVKGESVFRVLAEKGQRQCPGAQDRDPSPGSRG